MILFKDAEILVSCHGNKRVKPVEDSFGLVNYCIIHNVLYKMKLRKKKYETSGERLRCEVGTKATKEKKVPKTLSSHVLICLGCLCSDSSDTPLATGRHVAFFFDASDLYFFCLVCLFFCK